MESYEKAFDVIGFGYKSDDKYEDCDFEWIWDDFKKIALGLAIEEVQKMNKEEIEAWFDDHQIGVSKDSENLDYILEVCGYKVPYAVGEDIDKVAEVLEKYCESL